jgi:hypothetical protein
MQNRTVGPYLAAINRILICTSAATADTAAEKAASMSRNSNTHGATRLQSTGKGPPLLTKGYAWSYFDTNNRIFGHPIWQPYTGSSFQFCTPGRPSDPPAYPGSSVIDERRSPQKCRGRRPASAAVKRQPRWLPHVWQYAMVQAYPGNQLQKDRQTDT